MRWLFPIAVLASVSGCAAVAPLDEPERARIRVVAPVAARFTPKVEFNVPPGKAEGAATWAAGGVVGSAAVGALHCGPFVGACFALVVPITVVSSAVVGAAGTPSSEGLEVLVGRAHSHLGATDVQQLLVQRFAVRAARLTPYRIVPGTNEFGPQSFTDEPSYSSMSVPEGAVVAEVAVGFVGATLIEPFELFGADYASRPLRIRVVGRMRLVRPSDNTAILTQVYVVERYARRIQEYQNDGTLLLKAVAGAIDEVATLMVDDAFLLRLESAGGGGYTYRPSEVALEPLPARPCLQPGFDCWLLFRVPTLSTASPRFRWKPIPEPGHLETDPWLRAARNPVYDLWIFGGDDDRVVEGLKTTEYVPERPLAECMRFSWAVRARFDTDAGPRALEWSSASSIPRRAFMPGHQRPTFGAPFITPCPVKADASQPPPKP